MASSKYIPFITKVKNPPSLHYVEDVLGKSQFHVNFGILAYWNYTVVKNIGPQVCIRFPTSMGSVLNLTTVLPPKFAQKPVVGAAT